MQLKGLKALIASAVISTASLFSNQIANAANPADGKVDRYAVVVVGDSEGEKGVHLDDPIDKNFMWLAGVGTYARLQELGFEHENIYFLYDDGNPDFTEEKYQDTIKFIQEHEFNEPKENKKATIKNLVKIIRELSQKVDEDDVFVFAINTHGGYNTVSIKGGSMSNQTLDRLLEKIEPRIGLACIDACHSGYFIRGLSLDDYVVISSTDNNVGWADRNYSPNRALFQNMLEPENDTDNNGKVSIAEAHHSTDKKGKEYWKAMLPWLKRHYKGDRSGLNKITFNPQIKIGKKASGDWAIYEPISEPE
jgi:hypothetical protein